MKVYVMHIYYYIYVIYWLGGLYTVHLFIFSSNGQAHQGANQIRGEAVQGVFHKKDL